VKGSAHDARLGLAAIAIALLSALFFTLTYVLNRAIANDGGHWAWTATLRYLITLPLLLPLMRWQGGMAPVWRALRAHPLAWLRCSSIGFVLF
jgi:drug/metabolite transporter (DMT)-like permease